MDYYNVDKIITEIDGKNICRVVGKLEEKNILANLTVKDIVIQSLRKPNSKDNEDIRYEKFLIISKLVNLKGEADLEDSQANLIFESIKHNVIDPWIMGQCLEVFK
jgi:hypothetical protein